MTESPKLSGLQRRVMLARASIATAAAAIAPALFAAPAQAFQATPEENAQRYKDSEHVKQYYKIIGR